MQSKDLRIGNLVGYIDGGIFKVIGIHKYGLDVEDDIETTYMEYEYFEPINLNYTILENLGWTERVNDYYYLGEYKIRFDEDVFYFMFFDLGDWEQKIEYVHELQNLYFALTGEELELKVESKP